MTKALELAKFGREAAPTGLVVGDSDAQTLSSKTFSDGPVFSGLNANAIPYLNASKVLSSSSTFVFDGTNIGLGIASPAATLHVNASGGGTIRASRSSVGGEYIQLDHDGTDGTLRVSGNNKLYLATNGSTRVTVLGGGNVGVGIQAPTAIIHTQSSGLGDGGGIKLGNSGSGGGTFAIWPTATINGEGADKLIFSGSGGNLVTITGAGSVGIGTTTPSAKLDVRGSTTATIRVGSTTHGTSGDEFANLEFYWGDPDAAEVKAKIYAKNVGNVGPGGGGAADLLFATTPAGGSLTERIRIDSAGNVRFGSTGTTDKPVHLIGTGTRQYFKAETTTNSLSYESGFEVKTPSSNFLIGSHGSTNALWIYDANATAERLRIDSAGLLILGNNIVNTGGGRFDLTSNGTSTIQARSNSLGTGDGTADVTVTRAVTAGASWWANARYDAYSHTWGYGGGATGSTAMRITGAGNLAIGTTGNTAQKLNVNGAIWLLGNDDANYSTIIAPRYDSNYPLTMQTRNNSGTMVEWLGIYADSGGANNRISLGSGGWKVGIGNTNPSNKLEITASGGGLNTAVSLQTDIGGGITITSDSSGQNSRVGLIFRGSDRIGAAIASAREDAGTTWKTYMSFYTNNQTGSNVLSLQEKMRLDSDGNLNILTTGYNDTNTSVLPGALKFTGTGWNTNFGVKPMGGQISLAGEYGQLNGGSTEPSLVFSLYGTGSNGYSGNDGPTSLTERMRINNYGKVTVTGNIVSTLGGPIYETIDCLNINPAGTGFDSIGNNSDGGGTYWQVVGNRVVDLYSTSGAHGGTWGYPVRIDTPGYYRLKLVARLSSTNGSIHGSTPAGNYKYSIPIGFVLNTFSVYGKWDVDALGSGTRVCALGTPAYCAAGTYQMTYSTSGYDGIKQIYLYEVVVERVG